MPAVTRTGKDQDLTSEKTMDPNENSYDGLKDDEKSPLLGSSGNFVISYEGKVDSGISFAPGEGQNNGTDSASSATLSTRCSGTLSSLEIRMWLLARTLGYISAVLLIILGIFCFIESSRSDSASVFAFAFSCLLDSSGAIVVIWRSFSTESPEKSKIRELQAQLIIGCLFWFAAMFILVRAMLYLNDSEDYTDEESDLLYILLGIGGGLQLFFFLTKTPLAIFLKSPALIADGVNSLAACVLAVAGVVATLFGSSSEKLAILDDLIGVIVGFFIAIYGTILLYRVWIDPIASEVFQIPRPYLRKREGDNPAESTAKEETASLLPSAGDSSDRSNG